MEKNYYLGFDAGTQSVKVAVYDGQMNCVAMDTAKTTLSYPQPGWVEMDIDEYYRLIKQCMRSCSYQMRQKHLSVKSVRAIMGDGIICGIAGLTPPEIPLRRMSIILTAVRQMMSNG